MKNILTISLFLICGLCFGQNPQNIEIFETSCDSVYENKGYKIVLVYSQSGIDTLGNNTVFQLLKTTDSKQKTIFQDTVFSQTGVVEFRDFNNDGIKDILLHCASDVRSNGHYYLYLVDTVHDKLQKIKGFEDIKNPRYLPQHNLIDNYVVSGKNWTCFYKIQGDSIRDFDIVIFDDQSRDGAYERLYKRAIQKITKE